MKTLRTVLSIIFPLACAAVLLYSTYHFLTEYNEYRRARVEYADLLEEMVTILPDSPAAAREEAANDLASGSRLNASDQNEKDAAAGTESVSDGRQYASDHNEGDASDNINAVRGSGKNSGRNTAGRFVKPEPFVFPCPALEADYAGLRSMNSDFVGVLYFPALEMCYPVAHSHDNLEYLKRTFSGSFNASGCIFLDRYDSPSMDDQFTLIFGHNMKNGTMFGSLKKLAQDKSLCENDPYFYIYTTEGVYVYRIFAYGQISSQDELYELPPRFYDEENGTENEEQLPEEAVDTAKQQQGQGSSANSANELEHDMTENDVMPATQYANNTTIRTWEDLLQHLRDRSAGAIDLDDEIIENRPGILTLSTCWGVDHVYNFIVSGVLLGRTMQ